MHLEYEFDVHGHMGIQHVTAGWLQVVRVVTSMVATALKGVATQMLLFVHILPHVPRRFRILTQGLAHITCPSCSR